MDVHDPKFQSFVIHQLPIGHLESLYELFKDDDEVAGTLDAQGVHKHTPITEAEIKALQEAPWPLKN